MTSTVLRPGIVLCGIACLWCGQIFGEEPSPGQPTTTPTAKAIAPPTAVQNPARPPISIKGRIGTTIMTDRDRVGITHHGSTSQFPKYPMTRQMDGSLPHNRKFGDGTVMTGADRLGITHAGKTIPFGLETGTKRTGWPKRGLTTLHTQGRAWSSLRKAP